MDDSKMYEETTVVKQNEVERLDHARTLRMETPARKISGTTQGVRKRSTPPSPSPSEDEVDAKRRQVSKCLLFGSPPVESMFEHFELSQADPPARKCLYGPPREEDNARVLRSVEEKLNQKYEEFRKRFAFGEDDEWPPQS